MAKTITLALYDTPATNVTVAGASYPVDYPVKDRQEVGFALSGADKVAKLGDEEERFKVDLRFLDSTDRTALEGFIRNDMDFKMKTVTLTDGFGVDYEPLRLIQYEWFTMPNGQFSQILMEFRKVPT